VPTEQAQVEIEPALGRRSKTTAPALFITLSSDDLLKMDDLELLKFADEVLGLAIPIGTKRTKIMTKIINAASASKDGI
jgi:hypothetical protein